MANVGDEVIDFVNISDEDFAKMERPPAIRQETDEPVVETLVTTETEEVTEEVNQEEVSDDDTDAAKNVDDSKPVDETNITEKNKKNPLSESDENLDKLQEKPKPKNAEQTDKKPVQEQPKVTSEVVTQGGLSQEEKAAAYDKLMGGFKANGKEIKLNNADEATQLMQMGANYTRKLQEIAPHRKIIKMLENNSLLDEGKLSFLIDLDKKNPEAIKKLMIDSKIDPMDIDTSVEPQYQAKSHAPSEQQMILTEVMEELVKTDTGKETLVLVNTKWDKQSKEAVFKDPSILKAITNHKEIGLYDQITSEVEKQKMLGNFTNIPFLNAYYVVGEEMRKTGRLVPRQSAQVQNPGQGSQGQVQAQPNANQTKQVLETRAARKPSGTDTVNNDRAKAAATTRTTAKAVKEVANPLSMSDEEFEKAERLAGRV